MDLAHGSPEHRSLENEPPPNRRHTVTAPLFLFALALGCFTTPALAADTVIGFDNLAARTEVSNQFHDQGVDLDTKLGGGAKQFPVVVEDAPTVSSPNVLDISNAYPIEFPGAYLRGTFTDPHHVTVSAKVRGRGFPSGPATGTTTLTAYDVSGKVVATGTVVASRPDRDSPSCRPPPPRPTSRASS